MSDIVTAAADPCGCALPFALLTGIEGRNDDMLYLPDREHGQRVPVHPIHLWGVLTRHLDVVQYQILHDDRSIDVLIVVREGSDVATTGAKVRAVLADSLARYGVVPPPITVVAVDEIPREQGPAGKVKLVKSKARTQGGH